MDRGPRSGLLVPVSPQTTCLYPEPIRPQEIGYRDLVPVPEEDSERPDLCLQDMPERFLRAVDPVWYEEHFTYEGEDLFNDRPWNDTWRHLPYEQLSRAYTFPELIKLWVGSVIASDLGDYIEKQEPLLWKVQNALWQYGCARDYNRIVRALDGLRNLRFDRPGFELRLTHTYAINTAGTAHHVKGLYLDAAFGAVLYYKGKHVLTIGFTPSDVGVLITQVQLREKKGNRFLFSLGSHYLDIAIDVIANAFVGQDLWLVDGTSAVTAVRKSYGKQPCSMTPEDEARIAAVYDRPLAAYDRAHQGEGDDKLLHRGGRGYVRLVPKVMPL